MTERFGRIDLHMHSTFSDGTDSPEELLRKARSEGLRLFSITDHDDVSSGKAVRALLKKDDPAFLPGVEFSCRDEYGKYHILGYGFDPDSSSVQSVVRRGHELRLARLQQRIDGLKTVFGITLPEEEIELLRKMDSPGKPHFGLLLVKYGFAETKKEAIEKYLNPLPVDSVYVRPGEAMEGILRGGGVPVLAHPFYGDGEDRLGPEEMEERLKHLIRCGLAGLEAFYSAFSENEKQCALDLAGKYRLLVTAGSDYHGGNKSAGFGETGLDESERLPEGLIRFLTLCEEPAGQP